MLENMRMTVDRVKSLIYHHGVHLTHGQWLPTDDDPKGYCPTGMYIVDLLGEQPVTPDNGPDVISQDFYDKPMDGRRFNQLYTRGISELVGIPYEYLAGLNDGYEPSNFNTRACGDSIINAPTDYLVGVADGRILRDAFPA